MRTSKRTLAALLCLTAGLGGVLMADVSGASAQATTNHAVRDDDGGKSDAALQAQLSSASGGHATFSFSGSGEATYIGGSEAYPLQARSGDGQELIARRFIDAYAPLFGVKNTTTDLVQTQSFTGASGAGGAVKYQQTFKGIPVIAGVLAVQVSSSGAVLSATGEASPDLAIDATSTISADQASLSGVAGVARQAGVDPSTLSADTSVLSIYDPTLLGAPDALGARLVWRFDVRDAIGGVDWFVLIDAHDGTVALQFDQQEAALNRSICDNNENTAITETCTAPVRTEGQLPVGAAHPDVDNAYDLSGATWNFYMSHFGRDSVDNAGLPLKSTVRFCYPTPQPCPYANAFWNGEQMVYGTGYANADDVVGHELTHGVTQYTSGLFYYGASGALNESMSDVMGEFIDQVTDPSADAPADKWLLGEDLIIGAIRNMADPPTFGDPDKLTSPNYYDGYSDNHGVHFNSGVNNKADFLIADGGTFNGQSITGIGPDKAARIYYQVETTLLTPGSDYMDMYNALQQACSNLIGVAAPVGGGITATDCQQVTKAVTATEMNYRPTVTGRYRSIPACDSGVQNSIAFSDDMESNSSRWITSTTGHGAPWGYYDGSSVSGTRSMRVVDNTGPLGTSTLTMANPVTIPTGPEGSFLSFLHSYNTDSTSAANIWDGGVVEYSTDGSTWKDIAAAQALPAVHGYGGTISAAAGPSSGPGNPLGGRAGFGGNSGGYEITRVDTSSLAGQSVRFRFEFAIDGWVDYSYEGWFIDDVTEYGCGAAKAPLAPRAVTATGASGQATLTWQPPSFDGGSGITGYTITPYLGASAQAPVSTTNVTTAIVAGLTNGSTYTFTVTASNAAGTGASATSNAVTPIGGPDAPTSVIATPGDAKVSVSWTAPANNGGSAIIGYVVTPFLGATALPSSSAGNVTSIVVNGLTNGQAYTFTVAAVNAIGTGAASAPSGPVTPTAAIPLLPGRVLDTRIGGITVDGRSAGIGIRSAGSVTELTVAGRAGVAADAAAVVLNVTVSAPLAAGYVTVYPCGSQTPRASNLNYVAGQTIPNLVVTKIGALGQVCLFTQSDTDLIVDVSGYFPPNSALTPLTPARLLETRSGASTVDGVSNGVGRVGARSVTEVQVGGRAGVPANADAAILNVTVVGPDAPGYVTVYPCGTNPPTASNLNYGAGQTIADAVVTKIGAGGKVCVFSQRATDLVLDVNGYFPAGSSLTSLLPARLLDSRADGTTVDGQAQAIGVRPAGSVTEVVIAGRGGVPMGAAAVVLNVTVTEPTAAGYATVYPCGTEPPTASNLNYGPGLTIANAVISKVGAGGQVCVFTQAQTHLVVDVNAYLAG